MHYIVNVSGGLTSFEALDRALARHGKGAVTAIFADVRGESQAEHAGEDEDTYRFLDDQEHHFGIPIVRLSDGRDIWQAMKDSRAITLMTGSGFTAACSTKLKREVIDRYVAHTFAGQEVTRVFGYEWHEIDRMEGLQRVLAPTPAWFPLSEPPYVDKCWIGQKLEALGIAVPRMYLMGFEHNNCGGFCVKAGQAHMARLYFSMPERYRYHEAKEEEIRQYLGKDVSVLRDRRGGQTKPMTLRAFRERLERGEAYDQLDWGGCGCFAPVSQGRLDILLDVEVKLPAPRQRHS